MLARVRFEAMKKILVSPGYGAGWSTWNDKFKEVAEYEPIIKFLEDGGDRNDLLDAEHPLIQQMIKDLDLSGFCTAGADQLQVESVDGPYRIDVYDGYEMVQTSIDFW